MWRYFSAFLGFLVGCLAVLFYDVNYIGLGLNQKNIQQQGLYDGFYKGEYGQHNYVGTGIITNTQGNKKYIFIDSLGGSWIIDTNGIDKFLSLQDLVFVVGQKKMVEHSYTSGFSVPSFFLGKFDYEKWMFMKGYRGIIYAHNVVVLGKGNISGLQGFITKTRNHIFFLIDKSFPQKHISGLLRGLLLGDKSMITRDDYENFINSGLVHIIAVSGGNMLMLVIFLHAVLFFVPYYFRIFLILCGLFVYAFLCGLDSSVFRALIMGGLTLFAVLVGRIVSIQRLLLYARLVMLIINPYVLFYDMGFLLSFGALVGIVLFQKYSMTFIRRLWYIPKQIAQKYILPSIGASIGVLPILVFFVGKINITSIIGNILIVPLVPCMMLFGLFASLFSIPFHWFYTWVSNLLNFVYIVADWSSRSGIYLLVNSPNIRMVFFVLIILLYVCMFFLVQEKNTKEDYK